MRAGLLSWIGLHCLAGMQLVQIHLFNLRLEGQISTQRLIADTTVSLQIYKVIQYLILSLLDM